MTLEVQSRSVFCIQKILSKLGHVKSKAKETTRKELFYKTEGKVQMTKIKESTRSGKGNVKP